MTSVAGSSPIKRCVLLHGHSPCPRPWRAWTTRAHGISLLWAWEPRSRGASGATVRAVTPLTAGRPHDRPATHRWRSAPQAAPFATSGTSRPPHSRRAKYKSEQRELAACGPCVGWAVGGAASAACFEVCAALRCSLCRWWPPRRVPSSPLRLELAPNLLDSIGFVVVLCCVACAECVFTRLPRRGRYPHRRRHCSSPRHSTDTTFWSPPSGLVFHVRHFPPPSFATYILLK